MAIDQGTCTLNSAPLPKKKEACATSVSVLRRGVIHRPIVA
jgi:hypothetical protein